MRHEKRAQIGRIQWRIMYLKTRNELTSDGGEVTFAPFTTPYNVFHVESRGRSRGANAFCALSNLFWWGIVA
jgi:hypothetical protein